MISAMVATLQGLGSHGMPLPTDPRLLWMHVGMDVLIGVSYVAISATLAYLVWRGRREFPFQRVFLAFGLFIVACGATHFMGVYTLWTSAYWLDTAVLGVTAAASLGTAILLPPLVPKVLHTIREARLSEERRVRAEGAERFRTMAEAIPQIAWTADPDGNVDYYNRRWFEYTGIPAEAGHGWGWQSALHPDDAERTLETWKRSIATGEPYEIVHRIRAADGEYRWMLSLAAPARDGASRIMGWFGSGTDVDVQKRAEDELRLAKEEAERANRAKSEFLSTMSHELRTPLNAIAGHVDLIELGVHGEITEGQARALERVKQNQGQLLALINDVLHYARIEAGHLEVAAEEVCLGQIVQDSVALLEPQIRGAGLEWAATTEPEISARADHDRVGQILLNLLVNAIKFTPEGGRIEVASYAEGERAFIRIRDDGPGIPAEMVERIFDPFVQVRDSKIRDSSRQGVGLGLAISRDLARAMSGDLTVETALGSGSAFTLSLPRWGSMPEGPHPGGASTGTFPSTEPGSTGEPVLV